MGAKLRDITGFKYNMLTVVKILPSRMYGTTKKRMWLCQCDCGNEIEINTSALLRNNTKSCGCLKSQKSIENSIKSRHKLAKEDGGYRSIYSSYKRNAITRNLNFDIDFDFTLNIMKSNCYYCGIEPSNIYKKSYYNVKYNGIDRVDNSKGYNLDNIVPCCKMCNVAKNNNSQNEFLNWIKRISDYQKLKRELK
jgi:hypothetical protein